MFVTFSGLYYLQMPLQPDVWNLPENKRAQPDSKSLGGLCWPSNRVSRVEIVLLLSPVMPKSTANPFPEN